MNSQNELQSQHINVSGQLACIEPLENRRLFAFSTVDVVSPGEGWGGMAADGLGNVYVAGLNSQVNYVRQGSNNGSHWADILTVPWNGSNLKEIFSVATSPAGAVYVGVLNSAPAQSWQILERPVGDTEFHSVHSVTTPGGGDILNLLAVDANGQTYALGQKAETVLDSRGRATTQVRWNVWKQAGSMGAFGVVDTFAANENATAIAASTSGVYAVGYRMVTSKSGVRTDQWIVRKSATGAPGTWTTVDVFQHDAANNLSSSARAVTVDSAGNVYVAGEGYKNVRTGGTDRKPIYTTVRFALVRKSSNGGASWTTDVVDSTTVIDTVETDSLGNLYVAGNAQINGADASVVRMKAAGGTAWNAIDQVGNAEGSGFTADSNDNLYVAGTAYGSDGSYAGFVRMQPAPAVAAAPSFAATFSSVALSWYANDDANEKDDLVALL